MRVGKVYLVGAGPGDPGLLTVRGLELLRKAEVVVYDRLVNPALLDEAPPEAIRIFAGKLTGSHSLPQEQINALLIAHARRGWQVVRLKGGCPFVFGRGGEEAEALAEAGVPFEVVPGVSSAIAVPAYAGIPLTYRGLSSSFAVVTGNEAACKDEPAVDWERLATAVDTIVVLMGVKALPRIVGELLAHGRSPDTPVALIRWGTTEAEETITGTLADILDKAAGLEPPVVVVLGEVVRLRDRLHWFERHPVELSVAGTACPPGFPPTAFCGESKMGTPLSQRWFDRRSMRMRTSCGVLGGFCCIGKAVAVGIGLSVLSFFGTSMDRYQPYFVAASGC